MAPASLRSLISSPGHANMLRFFPYSRRPCWRRPFCEALFLRRVTPTCPSFSRAVAGRVGAFLPAKPYFFAGRRQHAPVFLGRSPPMLAPSSLRSLLSSPGGRRQHAPVLPISPAALLASSSLRSLISSPSHANMLRFFPGGRRPCWRLPSC